MKKTDKLLIATFTNLIERYQDTKGALKEIYTILDTPEDVLYKNLQDAYQQSHRIRVLRQNNIGLSHDDIGSGIITPKEKESLVEELLEPQVSIEQLKKFIEYQLKKLNNGKNTKHTE